MPRPRKRQVPKKQSSWYHAVPGALWYGTKILAGAAATHYGGPMAGYLLKEGLSHYGPNQDYWDPLYQDGTHDAYQGFQGGQGRYPSIPDIDDVADDWAWIPHNSPFRMPSGWYRDLEQ